MTRSPDDFSKDWFDGGRHLTGRGKGPHLVDLLNVINQAFFDGVISVSIHGDTGWAKLQAVCPFTGEPMTGTYRVHLSVHQITDDGAPYPLAKVKLDEVKIGSALQKTLNKPELTIQTDPDGSCAFRITGKSGDLPIYIAAFSYVPTNPGELIPSGPIWMLRPIASEPFFLKK